MSASKTEEPAKQLPKFQHHAFYESFADMEKAAEDAGYIKKNDSGNKFHFERPPGPCPEHGGNHVWWTQKMGYSYCGGHNWSTGVTHPYGFLMYAYS